MESTPNGVDLFIGSPDIAPNEITVLAVNGPVAVVIELLPGLPAKRSDFQPLESPGTKNTAGLSAGLQYETQH